MLPIGDSLFKKSFGLFLCSSVSTTPGATAFTRIRSFAYSMARQRVIASIPPLVIIGIEAFTPAIGLSASEAVMLTLLPPDFCASICLFFFQAEDGIRDGTVTGVQTCALPI